MAVLAAGLVASTSASDGIALELIARYDQAASGASGAEIVDYDPRTKTLLVVGEQERIVSRIDINSPTAPRTLLPLRIPDVPGANLGSEVTSVTVHNGIVAAAVPAADRTKPGFVALFDRDGLFVTVVEVGALPDMVKFTPDGQAILVANEGEPNDTYTVDPEGSLSIIDLSDGVLKVGQANVRTIHFSDLSRGDLDESVRIFGPNATIAQDVEPEYITISSDSAIAWTTLQENNAVATIDLKNAALVGVYGLGFRDFSRPGSGLDASDRDRQVNIQPQPVFGMYQPDSIVAFTIDGEQYIATANEGDPRHYAGFDESARVAELTLDETIFPNASELQRPDQLGRLNVTKTLGDSDGDGDYDALYTFGARSFAIWNDKFELVFESGDQFERIIAELRPDLYDRANADGLTLDDRSDNSGPEPEGLVIGVVNERTYAFIGLERAGGIMVYDVTEPGAARFVNYTNSRAVDSSESAQDVGPEGLLFVSADDSPTTVPLVIIANEVSGTVLVYAVVAPDFSR